MAEFKVMVSVYIEADTKEQAREIFEDGISVFNGAYLRSVVEGVKEMQEDKETNWIEP